MFGSELKALLARPEISTGTFVYSRPNNVLWTYAAPRKVQMVIANGMMTTWFPDLGKAERVDVKRFEDRIFKYMGASGAIEIAASILALRDGFLPPTINLTDPDPECDLDYVPGQARKADLDVVLSNSFGFGGANTTLVLRKYEE